MLKFSVFLLLGTLLNTIGQTTPLIAAYVEPDSPTTEVITAVNQSNGIVILLSTISTPILVLVSFKPVLVLMKKYLLHVYAFTQNVSEGVEWEH